MSELINDVSKNGIRSQLNLIFSMMRFLATILDMAPENKMVQETVSNIADGVTKQAAILKHDVGEYISTLSDC